MLSRLRGAALGVALLAAGGAAMAPATHASTTLPGVQPQKVHLVLPRGERAASNAAAAASNLNYLGGPVEASGTVNYAIFWEPTLLNAVTGSVSPTYNSLITRFLQDVGGSSIYGVNSQYYQQSGGATQHIANASTFGGAWVDTSLYPGPVLLDSEIQSEVTKAMAANHWTAGIGHEFFVFTGKNEIVCSGAACSNVVFCAYHSSFTSGSSTVLYADQPYTDTLPTGCTTPTSPNGDLAADSTINVVSHELAETVTDPDVGTPNYAWQDSSGSEIGDKCNFMFGPTNAGGADTVINGHPYIVQQEWSNAISGCSMS